jgi:hypothetical protein
MKIADTQLSIRLREFEAIIDSGADCSCIPKDAIEGFKLNYEKGFVTDYDGKRHLETFIRILKADIEFIDTSMTVRFRGQYSDLRLLVISAPEGLIGRDILNFHLCQLNGPKLSCNFY